MFSYKTLKDNLAYAPTCTALVHCRTWAFNEPNTMLPVLLGLCAVVVLLVAFWRCDCDLTLAWKMLVVGQSLGTLYIVHVLSPHTGNRQVVPSPHTGNCQIYKIKYMFSYAWDNFHKRTYAFKYNLFSETCKAWNNMY